MPAVIVLWGSGVLGDDLREVVVRVERGLVAVAPGDSERIVALRTKRDAFE